MRIHQSLWTRLSLIAAIAVMTGCATTDLQPDATLAQQSHQPAARMDTLVTAEWLSEHLDDPDLVVLDCTVHVGRNADGSLLIESGRADHAAGHIPGAGFADLMGDLSDSDSPYMYTVPTPEEFAAVMGALGVGDDSRVVLYDASMSVWAARVWWMLRWAGFDQAAMLDGGLGAWTAAGLPLSTEPVDRPAKHLTIALRPGLIADRDEVLAAIDDAAVSIIDVMPEAHYRGDMAMYARPGHILSATNVPVMALIDESGRYRAHDELAALFTGDREARVITYCGGGIAASSAAFIMTRLGFTDVAVYTASLQEWTADPANPMAVETD